MNLQIRSLGLATAALAAVFAVGAPAFADGGHSHGGGFASGSHGGSSSHGGSMGGSRGSSGVSHGGGNFRSSPGASHGGGAGRNGGGGGHSFSGGGGHSSSGGNMAGGHSYGGAQHFSGGHPGHYSPGVAGHVYGGSPGYGRPGGYGRGGVGAGRPGFVSRPGPSHGYGGWHGGSNFNGGNWHGGSWRGRYWPGVYYRPGYVRFLPFLPGVYSTFWFGGISYYYANDLYYTWNPDAYGYVVTDPPPVADSAAPADSGSAEVESSANVYVYPRNGQSDEQTSTDRFECHQWAVSQTGFDPTSGSSQSASGNSPDDYKRALTACLDARGYSAN